MRVVRFTPVTCLGGIEAVKILAMAGAPKGVFQHVLDRFMFEIEIRRRRR